LAPNHPNSQPVKLLPQRRSGDPSPHSDGRESASGGRDMEMDDGGYANLDDDDANLRMMAIMPTWTMAMPTWRMAMPTWMMTMPTWTMAMPTWMIMGQSCIRKATSAPFKVKGEEPRSTL
jgi:hypothetical protein